MPLAPLRGSQPTGGIGGRGVGVGAGVDTDPAEAAVENDFEVVAATGVEAGGPPAGVSATDGEGETKLSFFFRNSSLLLAFLLWVEGLILFLSTVDFALIPLVSKEKEKEVLVSLKLKALPWLANVWQKARHWDTKEESISAVIFTCSSQLRKLQKDQRSCHQNPDDYNNIFDASCLAKYLGYNYNIELKSFFSISITTDYFHEANHKRCSKSFRTSEYMKLMNINSALRKITSSTTFMSPSM